jgi:hypothetical protein
MAFLERAVGCVGGAVRRAVVTPLGRGRSGWATGGGLLAVALIISSMDTMPPRLLGDNPQAERGCLGDDLEYPTVRDVHSHRTEVRHLDRPVRVDGEGGHEAKDCWAS